ncbi:MAG: PhzF family phenazine biosynthesis protein [Oscillospiraceae bacterium]|nr:PhzF family phenazine biosynthesis protein [Oscillospiraceae bacterium]
MKQYIVDAFTDEIFHGNPAAVCILDKWVSEKLMTDITAENNLSETAFAVKTGGRYSLRWFTPGGEIDLCGHATLAAAFVITSFYEKGAAQVAFDTLSGTLTVTRKGELYEMDFPAYSLRPVPVTAELTEAIGAAPREAYMGRDLLCVFDDAEVVKSLNPNQQKLLALDGLLLHATAAGEDFDCVSRSFAPKCGVAEDPVCGSGHCHIAPYWASRLGKSELAAYQASRRGGALYCRVEGERVKLAGKAVLYSCAELNVREN